MVASIPESEWDGNERGWMIALQEYRAGLCVHCGGELTETTDPHNEDGYRHDPPVQCNRCVELERARKEYEEQPYAASLMHRVKLRYKHRR